MSLLFKAMAEFAEKEAIDGQNMGLLVNLNLSASKMQSITP
jgi:hypothetical protein